MWQETDKQTVRDLYTNPRYTLPSQKQNLFQKPSSNKGLLPESSIYIYMLYFEHFFEKGSALDKRYNILLDSLLQMNSWQLDDSSIGSCPAIGQAKMLPDIGGRTFPQPSSPDHQSQSHSVWVNLLLLNDLLDECCRCADAMFCYKCCSLNKNCLNESPYSWFNNHQDSSQE